MISNNKLNNSGNTSMMTTRKEYIKKTMSDKNFIS